MFESLKGKKLLFLGGVQRACAIVKRARELGVYVAVADYNEDSPAKKFADEAVLISATDIDALTEYCLKNNIDGVTTAYADILLPICLEVGKRIGKPFYADELMIQLATDKVAFKQYCEKYDVPVPKTYNITADDYKETAKNITYPVFIKPTDASGSRGADICYDYDDFCKKMEYALTFSKKREVTVEDYLSGTEFILDYILIDGEIYMLSMADRYTSKGRPIAINNPNLMVLPSMNLEQYYKVVDPKVKNMFRELGFKNGVIFLQGYAKDDKITFYEMGCRLGGTWPYIDEVFSGFNPIDLLVSHAVTGKMLPERADLSTITPFFNGIASIIYFISSQKSGKIAKLTGFEEVKRMPEVAATIQYYREGDSFELGRMTDVLFLAIHLTAPNYNALNLAMEQIYKKLDYLDENGKSLMTSVIHLDEATQHGVRVCKIKESQT
ncbi:MAG: ATP-grasp domain-containing protein [Fibrobacter sp.]|uniref:ATP-binding protein n=1 Tax=Fibrobacter sp. TaxID=35828 RepID=UPI0025BB6B59|nr:ATP-grasp domain-containing protein [Fibrobacter sp.]MBQ3719877.1 ATP-grasp domain-containing protein [Fibrobacter sp.]MBQ7078931.1 ATP-grasp domain-containing protein [Fibrobacter sp.]